MKNFCMPADFKLETLDAYAELNRANEGVMVFETYGNILINNQFGSGRNARDLPKVDMASLHEYVAHSSKLGIDFNYTINAPYMNNMEFTKEGVADFTAFLKELYAAGVRSLTLAMPPLFELANSTGLDFSIRASVICNINSANKALEWKKRGVERIVVDESIARDFKTLKSIVSAFGDKVEIIANSLCQQDCADRIFHYNQTAGDSIGVSNAVSCGYYLHRCALRAHKDPSTLLKAAWIRPEDLKYYEDIGIEYFKFQGRHFIETADPVRMLQAYIDESYDGNLTELFYMFSPANKIQVNLDNRRLDGFLKPFVENEGFCSKNCSEHGYCNRFAQKALEGTGADQIFAAGCQYLEANDPFRQVQQNPG